MFNQPLKKFLEIKGLGDVKIIRIAAAFEIARRIVKNVLREKENLKEPVRKKATKRNTRYFATSNFQSLIVFDTEKVNAMKPLEEQIVVRYSLSQLEDLNEIETPKFRNSIYTGLERFVLDLTEFAIGKKPEPLMEIDHLLVWRLQEKVNRLSRYYRILDILHSEILSYEINER